MFTKLLNPAEGHWRNSGLKVCMFLDDGLGGNSSFESAASDAKAVETGLGMLGFVLSGSKYHCLVSSTLFTSEKL